MRKVCDYMKKSVKRFLTLLVVAVSVLLVLSFAACKKEESAPTPSAPSVSEEIDVTEKETEPDVPAKEEADTPKEEEKEVVMQSLSFNIGNDIGRNVIALQIKPEENTQWTEVNLEKIWASGYMIPVTLTSEELPDDAKWEINIVFDDETEETFKGITITDGAELILTPDEVVY